MTEPVPEDISRALAAADRRAYLEQRLFIYSPFGTLPTTIIIFIVLLGTFAIAWIVSGRPFVAVSDGKLLLGPLIGLGLWFVAMLTTVLGIQRYTRTKDRQDMVQFAAVLRGGWETAARMANLAAQDVPLGLANLAGLALGAAVSWFFYYAGHDENLRAFPALLIWFSIVTTLLIMTFTRGVALTRSGTRNVRKTIEDELIIDLLRIDRLTVIGRAAARPSVVWFTISAVTLLAFIGGGITAFTVSLLVACAAMGIWVFVATMEHVHRQIMAAKAAELERLRGEIDTIRARAANEADCSVRLQGLLAYETRIVAAPEWPFDQTTLVRVGASALILTVPWFGQAIAAYVVDHLSRILG